jgi:hypothetical protein
MPTKLEAWRCPPLWWEKITSGCGPGRAGALRAGKGPGRGPDRAGYQSSTGNSRPRPVSAAWAVDTPTASGPGANGS